MEIEKSKVSGLNVGGLGPPGIKNRCNGISAGGRSGLGLIVPYVI